MITSSSDKLCQLVLRAISSKLNDFDWIELNVCKILDYILQEELTKNVILYMVRLMKRCCY